MTTEQFLAKRLHNHDEDDIAFLISSATAIYKSITHYDEVLPEHENWIQRACLELAERENFTAARAFSENGLSVTYDAAQLSQALRGELPNNANLYKKDGSAI